jgi:glycosyltransferase involved in cell wall biosynthesis
MVLRDPARARELGSRAKKRVEEEFDHRAVWKAWSSFYREQKQEAS